MSTRLCGEGTMPAIGRNHFTTLADYSAATTAFPRAKRCLAFGDSWFQYPLKPIDIEKQLARAFKGTLFLDEAVPGRDSAQWKLALPRVQREIGTFRFDAILLSSGGNDVVGDELLEYVKTSAQAQAVGTTNWGPIPAEVFDHIRLDRFEHALAYAIGDFREIVQYRNMYSRDTIVFVHTYDYIYPSGDPFELGPLTVGPWAKPALDAVGLTDPDRQRVVTSWLLDQFAASLKAFASQNANVRVVDSRGTLTSKRQWQNEIHPTKAGFALIANECWVPALTGMLA